jgi:hypothetical protein
VLGTVPHFVIYVRESRSMLLSEDEVKETIEMMNNGEISVYEAWEILDYFDGDLIEFL